MRALHARPGYHRSPESAPRPTVDPALRSAALRAGRKMALDLPTLLCPWPRPTMVFRLVFRPQPAGSRRPIFACLARGVRGSSAGGVRGRCSFRVWTLERELQKGTTRAPTPSEIAEHCLTLIEICLHLCWTHVSQYGPRENMLFGPNKLNTRAPNCMCW